MKIKIFYILLALFIFYTSPVLGENEMNIEGDSMKILKMGEVVEFKGNVRVWAPEMTATADRALMDRDGESVRAYDNVELHYSSGSLSFRGWCGELSLNRGEEFIIMEGGVKIIYEHREDDFPSTIISERAEFNFKGERQDARFEDNVRVLREDIQVDAGLVIYDGKEEIFNFRRRPRALSRLDEAVSRYRGDEMIFNLKGEGILIKGSAVADIKLGDYAGM